MLVRVDYLIYMYIALCVCMLAFNLFYMGKSRWQMNHNPEKIVGWEKFISEAAEHGGEIPGKASVIRKLSRPRQLVMFHEAVQNLLADEKSVM